MYDKARCLNNIYALAKERGIKIGDLEESAGVSKGYLSRVAKPDYQGWTQWQSSWGWELTISSIILRMRSRRANSS